MPGMKAQLELISVTLADDASQTETKTSVTVFAEELPKFSNEFHSARASGKDLQHVMKVHSFEYSGQTIAKYKGKEFDIYRDHQKDDDWIELYLSNKGKP